MAPPKMTTKKRKPEKAPPIDKLIVPAIGIALAIMGYRFYQGLAVGSIDRIDVTDDLALREVFFGEVSGKDSYAVLCHADDPSSSIPISSVFSDAYTGGSSPAKFRLLDCNHVLPDSGKTIAERFNLKLDKRPTIFVSGAVGEPKQIPEKHLKTGNMLDKILRNMLEPRAAKIETTQDLRSKCLNQPYCALLLKGSKTVDGGTKKAIQKLLVEQPKIAFASIDTSNLFVKNLEEYLPEFSAGRPRFVVFKKVSGSLDSKDSRLVTSIAPLEKAVSYGTMSNLCADVMSGKETMQKISTLPMIKTRTKKLEAEERAKRERRKEQQQRTEEKASAPSMSPTENDGSRDGRRAERERRRAEHRAETGAKERTPEEIAEMERQRRIRMQESEKAWTVQDGDLPTEGESVDDIDMDGIMEEEYDDGDDGSGEESRGSGDEDGDLLDLD